jgi:hypothetical protein
LSKTRQVVKINQIQSQNEMMVMFRFLRYLST